MGFTIEFGPRYVFFFSAAILLFHQSRNRLAHIYTLLSFVIVLSNMDNFSISMCLLTALC